LCYFILAYFIVLSITDENIEKSNDSGKIDRGVNLSGMHLSKFSSNFHFTFLRYSTCTADVFLLKPFLIDFFQAYK